MVCPFTAECRRAAPQNGHELSVDHLEGSLNVRPAVRGDAAQSSGPKSMVDPTSLHAASQRRWVAWIEGQKEAAPQGGPSLGRKRPRRAATPNETPDAAMHNL